MVSVLSTLVVFWSLTRHACRSSKVVLLPHTRVSLMLSRVHTAKRVSSPSGGEILPTSSGTSPPRPSTLLSVRKVSPSCCFLLINYPQQRTTSSLCLVSRRMKVTGSGLLAMSRLVVLLVPHHYSLCTPLTTLVRVLPMMPSLLKAVANANSTVSLMSTRRRLLLTVSPASTVALSLQSLVS